MGHVITREPTLWVFSGGCWQEKSSVCVVQFLAIYHGKLMSCLIPSSTGIQEQEKEEAAKAEAAKAEADAAKVVEMPVADNWGGDVAEDPTMAAAAPAATPVAAASPAPAAAGAVPVAAAADDWNQSVDDWAAAPAPAAGGDDWGGQAAGNAW